MRQSAAKNIASNCKVFSEYWIWNDDIGSSRQDSTIRSEIRNPTLWNNMEQYYFVIEMFWSDWISPLSQNCNDTNNIMV